MGVLTCLRRNGEEKRPKTGSSPILSDLSRGLDNRGGTPSIHDPSFARHPDLLGIACDLRMRKGPRDARAPSLSPPTDSPRSREPWWSSGANLQLSLWRQTTAAIQQQSKSFVKRVSAVLGSGCGFREIGRARKRQRRTRAWGFFRLTPRRTYASSADIRTPHATVPPSAG